MNITKEFDTIFSGEQKITEEEQEVLQDAMCFMRDDAEMGMSEEVIMLWRNKITGIIEFLLACGKIDEKQEEDLHMMLNTIESGRKQSV